MKTGLKKLTMKKCSCDSPSCTLYTIPELKMTGCLFNEKEARLIVRLWNAHVNKSKKKPLKSA